MGGNDFNAATIQTLRAVKTLVVDPRRIKFEYKKYAGSDGKLYTFVDCADDCDAFVIEIDGNVFAKAQYETPILNNPHNGPNYQSFIYLQRLRTMAITLGLKLELNTSAMNTVSQDPYWSNTATSIPWAVKDWVANIKLSRERIENECPGNVKIGR